MYEVIQVKWEPNYQDEIKEIYRMFKDQERKIFPLTCIDEGLSVMDRVENVINEDYVFLVKDDNTPCAVFVLDNPSTYGNIITKINIHTAIRRPFWGTKAREICRYFIRFLEETFLIKKLIAQVPQCGYGVIKLLKDLGFKHEGTLKEATLYKDKNGNPKFYDELIYSLTRGDIK